MIKKKKKSTYSKRRNFTKKQYSKLNKAEEALKDLPDSTKKKNLLTAIRRKKKLLQKLWGLNNQYRNASGDEREDFNEDFEDTLDDFRDTSNFPDDSISGKCVACEILKEAKKLKKEAWEVVTVTPTDNRKQYVNFRTSLKWKSGTVSKIDSDPKPDGTLEHHGRRVLITAQIDKKSSKKRVYFQLHGGKENRTFDYKKAYLGIFPGIGEEITDFHGAQFLRPKNNKRRRRFRTHHNSSFIASTITDKKGEAKIIVQLGHYGGDEFCVSASAERPKSSNPPSAESAPSPKTGKFEVWKKLWYSQIEMKKSDGNGKHSLPPEAIDHSITELEKCKIKLIDSQNTDEIPHRLVFSNNRSFFKYATKQGTIKPKYDKREVVFVVIDTLLRENSISWEPKLKIFKNKGEQLEINNARIFNIGDYKTEEDTHPWLKLISAKDINGNDVKSHVDINPEGLSVKKATKITIKIKASSEITPDRFPVSVKIELYQWKGLNGTSSKCFTALCVGKMEESYGNGFEEMIRGTLLHEVSHDIGLARGLDWESDDHPGHCEKKKCVMWYSGYMKGKIKSHKIILSDGTVIPKKKHTSSRPIIYHKTDVVNCDSFIKGAKLYNKFNFPKNWFT